MNIIILVLALISGIFSSAYLEPFFQRNKNGASEIICIPQKSANSSIVYIYNTEGLLITEVRSSEYLSESHYRYQYDSSSNLIEAVEYYNGKISSKSIYKYDLNNNLIELAHYFNSFPYDLTNPSSKRIYEYDSNNSLTTFMNLTYQYHTYHPAGTSDADMKKKNDQFNPVSAMSKESYEYDYDSLGNKIFEKKWSNDLLIQFSYEYDSDSNLIKKTKYDNAGIFKGATIYEYYDNKMVEQLIYDSKGKLAERLIIKYDSKNNISELSCNTYIDNVEIKFDNFPNDFVFRGLAGPSKEDKQRFIFKYNKKNDVIKIDAYYLNKETGKMEKDIDNLATFKYEYHNE